jgi:hypothetical protein
MGYCELGNNLLAPQTKQFLNQLFNNKPFKKELALWSSLMILQMPRPTFSLNWIPW